MEAQEGNDRNDEEQDALFADTAGPQRPRFTHERRRRPLWKGAEDNDCSVDEEHRCPERSHQLRLPCPMNHGPNDQELEEDSEHAHEQNGEQTGKHVRELGGDIQDERRDRSRS